MDTQLDLFAWAEAKPSNVIDLLPALIRKAAFETIYQVPRPTGGMVVPMERRIA